MQTSNNNNSHKRIFYVQRDIIIHAVNFIRSCIFPIYDNVILFCRNTRTLIESCKFRLNAQTRMHAHRVIMDR